MSVDVEKLKAARNRISSPEKWIQGAYAYRLNGDDVFEDTEFDDPRAICFCALGALHVEEGVKSEEVDFLESIIGESLAHWNDAKDRSYRQVIMLFDHAISLAEAGGA